ELCGSELLSLFLIGSRAGAPVRLDDHYVDFDVHFLLAADVLSLPKGHDFRQKLSAIASEFSTDDIAAEWLVRDRHWKLRPRDDRALTVSIHATIANRFDFLRRALLNPVLGSNMYRLCEVLGGVHPGDVIKPRNPVTLEYFESAGGLGWIIENFYRAMLLH